ncbi:unnamed protein product [Thelazia callipaeda]|uniref:Uncharacterized protein n=1 Tax=Thelazia callipaeda TaxID=103827 RepID=A0A0N5CWZ7_THECL|nr:unnamed protein product [Thelazia callipaeda]
MFVAEKGMFRHCREHVKAMDDYLASQCEKMLYLDYTGRHNEEVVANENVEIRVDKQLRTAIRIKASRPNIMIHGKKRREVILTGQDRLTAVETKKTKV